MRHWTPPKFCLKQVDRTVAGEIARLFEPVITFAGMVAEFPGVTQSPDEDGHPALPVLLSSVEKNRAVASEYIGFDNGDMVLVIDLGEGYEDTRAGYDVPGTSRFVVQSYFTRADGVRVSTVTFLDADRQVTMSGLERDPTYDPRLRPWYLAAAESAGTVTTEPYVSSGPIGVGVTIARRVDGPTTTVFGADLSVSSITTFLDSLSESVGFSLLGPAVRWSIPRTGAHWIARAWRAGRRAGRNEFSDPQPIRRPGLAHAGKPLS